MKGSNRSPKGLPDSSNPIRQQGVQGQVSAITVEHSIRGIVLAVLVPKYSTTSHHHGALGRALYSGCHARSRVVFCPFISVASHLVVKLPSFNSIKVPSSFACSTPYALSLWSSESGCSTDVGSGPPPRRGRVRPWTSGIGLPMTVCRSPYSPAVPFVSSSIRR